MRDYLGSQIVTNTIEKFLEKELTLDENSTKLLPSNL